ncbi:MAG: M20/M25/M40 family metallo-hydrolase [candidate division WOR-3 bacterium]
MKKFGILFLVGMISIIAGAPIEYLVRIELNPQGRIYDLADMQICIIDELDGFCLAIISDGEWALLDLHNFKYKILDTSPRSKSYYIVYPAQWVPIDNLKPYGDILDYDGQAVIFRTEEKNIFFLNMMQVELKKVFFDPMVIKRDYQSFTAPPSSPLIDTLIQQMVSQVSSDTLLSFLNILTKNFGIRYSTYRGCSLAVRWFRDKCRSYGADSVYLHPYRTSYAENCIAIKRGIRYPNWKRYYVICGHIDAVSVSPGADDNGSGTACVLEAIRIMRRYRFENGIRFITFTGEEQGLYGSAAYASNARTQGDSVLGALNFDMIMYQQTNPDTLRLAIGRTRADTVLYNTFKAAVDTYTTQRTICQSLGFGSSDHASFWNNGYPAFCGIEHHYTSNPHYHTSHDSVGAPGYSIPFLTSCVKAAIAGLARLAVPMAAGVEELTIPAGEIPKLKVSPNPARTWVRFQISDHRDKSLSIKIYDITGKLVRETDQLIWDLRDDSGRRLPAGIYICRLNTEREESTAKIILLD